MMLSKNENGWSFWEKILFKFIFCWVLIFTCSFSFPHSLLPDIGHYMAPFFERIVQWFISGILHRKGSFTTTLISDSTGLYIHALLVTCYSIIITIIWSCIDGNKRSYNCLLSFFYTGIRYYLALQLFTYGFSKLFKWQFYLPEPNTLFTPIGAANKDLLYWTTMGASRSYTVFSGIVELVAAVLLLFRRTCLPGALLSAGIMTNVVLINFSFDISVKLYALFLLLLSLLLIIPLAKKLFAVFVWQQPVVLKPVAIAISPSRKKWYLLLKMIVVLLIICDPLLQYIKASNFNDDKAERPFLHGAYYVTKFMSDSTELAPLTTDTIRWEKAFVHRKGFFIVQHMDDTMEDFELQYDTVNHYLVLRDYEKDIRYPLHYELLPGDYMKLTGNWKGNDIDVLLRKIAIERLPLLQPEFNWTIDD